MDKKKPIVLAFIAGVLVVLALNFFLRSSKKAAPELLSDTQLREKLAGELIPLLAEELKQDQYARLKEDYLNKLRGEFGGGVVLPSPAAPSPAVPAPSAPAPAKSIPGSAPSRGAENAPITIMEFSDFHCPFCKRLSPVLEQLVQNYPGKVRRVFRHYPLPMHPGADRTHMASACAQEQGKFWEYYNGIFALPAAPQEGDLQTIAKNVGLDTKKFQDCLASNKYQSLVQQEVAEGSQKGVQGTPTVFVNDQVVPGAYPYEHFANLIEGILDPSKAVAAPTPPVPAAPPAPAEPVKFEDLEGRPALGPKDAPVTVVEFSDFHCPFCKRVTPTIEQLMKSYEGKIRRVWRHYPLSFHRGADRTHEASECAHEQGKFWQYHDKIFETQGGARDDAALTVLAEQAGLNKGKFENCLSSGKYKELIQKEIASGSQAGVRGTPAFFVNGKIISGAQPYENFDQAVKAELSKS
jgi:protein-disulfide isomerase